MRIYSLVLPALILLASACTARDGSPSLTPEVEKITQAALIPTPSEAPRSSATPELEATASASPPSAPSPSVAAMPELPLAPEGYGTYSSPYWVSFHYPADWGQVTDENPGDIVFATETFGLYRPLAADAAAFTVRPDLSEIPDPLEALENYWLPNDYPENATIIEPAEAITINDQPAATALVSFARDADTMVVRATVIAGPGRAAYVTAFTSEEKMTQYAPFFEVMLNSLVIGSEPSGPTIGTGAVPPPADYLEYADDQFGLSLHHPPDWNTERDLQGNLLLVPPGGAESSEQDNVLIADARELLAEVGGAKATAEELLAAIFRNLHFAGFDFATLVGEPIFVKVGDQEMARVMLDTTSAEGPELTIIGVVKTGDQAIIAWSSLTGNTIHRSAVESIMDSIVVSVPTFNQASEVIPLSIGELYEGRWTNGEQIDHSFVLQAGTPIVFLFQWDADILDLYVETEAYIYDPDSRRVDSFHAIGVTSESLFMPEHEGEYKLSFTPREYRDNPVGSGAYRLLVLDARPDEPGIFKVIEDELSAGQIDEFSFDGQAGQWLAALIQPASLALAGSPEAFEPRIELLDPGGESMTNFFASFGRPHADLLELPQDGIYEILVSPLAGESGRYRLVLYLSS